MKERLQMGHLRSQDGGGGGGSLVMSSKLNAMNTIKATNKWAVSLMRYGAGV